MVWPDEAVVTGLEQPPMERWNHGDSTDPGDAEARMTRTRICNRKSATRADGGVPPVRASNAEGCCCQGLQGNGIRGSVTGGA